MDYIISTKQLTKKYKRFTSVDSVSLHIRKGSIYGFLGPNGAGKSTTMKMLLGLTAPTKGSFAIDGKQFPADRLAILKEVGSFIESPSFFENMWVPLGIGVAGFLSGMAFGTSKMALFLMNPFVVMLKPAVSMLETFLFFIIGLLAAQKLRYE